MEGKRRIAILGSTGSIGTQALDVIRRHRDLFEVEMISAYSSIDLLESQAREFDVNNVVIGNADLYAELNSRLPQSKVFTGVESLCELVRSERVDIVVGAMVGFSGLRPTLAALEAGKIVALANKETLVAAGQIVGQTKNRGGGVILPVDSEHSAIFQCLLAARGNEVEKIHLTASGGPFRTWTRDKIAAATAAQALRHPNWDMGAKVTIDSATMMNKGFEVMEAYHLFGIDAKDIEVVVHPQSIIHSMVEFRDGAVIAQMGQPDMRVPIGLALSFPQRLDVGCRKLDFSTLASLSFEKPDLERFPNLGLAYEAIGKGGNSPCALNAANELAVKAFLEGKIGFYGITELIDKVTSEVEYISSPSLDDIFSTHEKAFQRAKELVYG